jgi:rhodanese-related sulfurtransferase
MSILDHFKSVPTMTADEVRTFLDHHDPSEYNLVDVRQPGEYEEQHLPGTKLIPIGELESRLDELDPAKPTVAY